MLRPLSAAFFRRLVAAALAIGAVAGAAPAWAGYRIGAGDTLGFSVAGLPELATKAPVDLDGNVVLPLVGSISVAGLGISEALTKVQSVLPAKEFRRRTDDGREFPVIISADEIGLTVSEYRPVYLSGDIAKPGEAVFRPGLTVRKAITLAGGFDIVRFKMDNPFIQLADLTSEYNSLWIQYAREQAAVARFQAELDGKQQIDPKLVMSTPIAPSLTNQILANERDQLAARNLDYEKEKSYLGRAATKEGDRARILAEQQSKEQDGMKSDVADLQRYTELNTKGAVALPALSEARRTVLLSSTRALQTTALLDSVEREQQDLDRKLERVGDSRRMEVLKEMQLENTALATTRAKLQAISDKLRYTGMVKSQLTRGADSKPKIVVMRLVDGRQVKVDADVDDELQPGDSVEVALQADETVGAMR